MYVMHRETWDYLKAHSNPVDAMANHLGLRGPLHQPDTYLGEPVQVVDDAIVWVGPPRPRSNKRRILKKWRKKGRFVRIPADIRPGQVFRVAPDASTSINVRGWL